MIAQLSERYNDEWLIERLGYRAPAQARTEGRRPPREDSAEPPRRRGP
jgi:hypothetical protein